MSHDSQSAMNTRAAGDEDDWDTDDVVRGPAAPQPQTKALRGLSLRPTANEFKPLGPTSSSSSSSFLLSPKILANPSTRTPAQGRAGENDEDEWFGSRRPMTNRQIWDSANHASVQPKILQPAPSLAPAPALQILRRPTSNGAQKRTEPQHGQGVKSLEERAEEYRLARERIFGVEAGTGATSPSSTVSGGVIGGGSGSGRNTPSGEKARERMMVPSQIRPSSGQGQGMGKGIVRQPRGPGEGGGGFGAT